MSHGAPTGSSAAENVYQNIPDVFPSHGKDIRQNNRVDVFIELLAYLI